MGSVVPIRKRPPLTPPKLATSPVYVDGALIDTIPPAELDRLATSLYATFTYVREFALLHPCPRTRRAVHHALQAYSVLVSGQETPVAEHAP